MLLHSWMKTTEEIVNRQVIMFVVFTQFLLKRKKKSNTFPQIKRQSVSVFMMNKPNFIVRYIAKVWIVAEELCSRYC